MTYYQMKDIIFLSLQSCILAGRWMDVIKEAPRKGYVVLAFPFGIILSLIIRGEELKYGKNKNTISNS